MIQGYKKILVGIDGSVESANAFDKAVAVAIRNDAELLLVNVIDLRAFQSISTYDTMVADDTKRGADQLIADFADEARAAGVTRIKTIVFSEMVLKNVILMVRITYYKHNVVSNNRYHQKQYKT